VQGSEWAAVVALMEGVQGTVCTVCTVEYLSSKLVYVRDEGEVTGMAAACPPRHPALGHTFSEFTRTRHHYPNPTKLGSSLHPLSALPPVPPAPVEHVRSMGSFLERSSNGQAQHRGTRYSRLANTLPLRRASPRWQRDSRHPTTTCNIGLDLEQ
jgi:hypothetical protein